MSSHFPGRPSEGVQWQDDGPTFVFLTVNTAARGRWLASDANHTALREAWTEADAWLVGHYVLMPDHVHLFCAPARQGWSIEEWIAYWKRSFAKHHGQPGWKWQSRGWHHRLRTAESYAEKLHYVRNNPVRAGLVHAENDWPFSGKMCDLIWRE